MTEVPPPSASPGSALTELQTDLALALRAPNVAMDRELLAAYVEAAAPNSIRALRQDNLLLVQGRDVQVPDWDALAAVGGFDGAYLELDDRWRRVE